MSEIDPQFLELLLTDDVLVDVAGDIVTVSHGDREATMPAGQIEALTAKLNGALRLLEQAADDYEERATERDLSRAFGDACKRAVEFTPAALGFVEYPAGSGRWRLAASEDVAYATIRYELPSRSAAEHELSGAGAVVAAYRSLLPKDAVVSDSDGFDPSDPQIVHATAFTAAGVEIAQVAGLETPDKRPHNVWAPSFWRWMPSTRKRGGSREWYPGKQIQEKLKNRPKVADQDRTTYLCWLLQNADEAAAYAATVAEAERLFQQAKQSIEDNTREWQRKTRAKRHLPPSAIKKIRSDCSHASYAERGWVTGGTFAVCVPIVGEERPREVEATPEELIYVGRFEHQDALRRHRKNNKRDKYSRFYSSDLDLFRELFPEPDFMIRVPDDQKVVFVARNIPEYVEQLDGAVALYVLAGDGEEEDDD